MDYRHKIGTKNYGRYGEVAAIDREVAVSGGSTVVIRML